MKNIFVILFMMFNLACASTARGNDEISTWDQARIEMRALKEQFQGTHLNEKEKVKLLPRTNEVLSYMQDLRLSQAQKREQIEETVELLAAAVTADFANSTTNTVYYDYKAHKQAYLNEIRQLKNQNEAQEILQAFKDWEEFEKNPNDF